LGLVWKVCWGCVPRNSLTRKDVRGFRGVWGEKIRNLGEQTVLFSVEERRLDPMHAGRATIDAARVSQLVFFGYGQKPLLTK
jgi:hypothetical protein